MMKLFVAAIICAFSVSSFAGVHEDLKIAKGEGDKCFAKAFMKADPTDDQKMKAREIHEAVKKVAEDNKQAMEDAAKAYMTVMMKHPIPLAEAADAAHKLGEAVHPVQAAMFVGSVAIINLLSADQRQEFNKAMHHCMH